MKNVLQFLRMREKFWSSSLQPLCSRSTSTLYLCQSKLHHLSLEILRKKKSSYNGRHLPVSFHFLKMLLFNPGVPRDVPRCPTCSGCTNATSPRTPESGGSKTGKPCSSSHQNRWDLWMFIPLKSVFNGIYRY